MTEVLSDTQAGFNPGVLDLAGADTTAASFDPIDAGRYTMEVWDAQWTETKEDSTGKLGPNFPYISVEVKIKQEGNQYNNRHLWTNFFPLAPEGYDPTKKARNQGAFVNFLVALGYKEEEVKSPQFQLDFDALKGKPFIGVVSKDAIPKNDPNNPNEEQQFRNQIKGFKAVGDTTVDAAGVGNAAQLL